MDQNCGPDQGRKNASDRSTALEPYEINLGPFEVFFKTGPNCGTADRIKFIVHGPSFWTMNLPAVFNTLSKHTVCCILNGILWMIVFCVLEFRSYPGHNQVRSTKVIRMHVIVTGHLWPSVFDGDKNVTLWHYVTDINKITWCNVRINHL